jgi:hypothetical protein
MFWWRKPVDATKVVDDRSRDEKLGIEVVPQAVFDSPGRDWAWAIEQMKAPWPPASRSRYVRRKCWPVATVKSGTVLPAGEGATSVVGETYRMVWCVRGDYPPYRMVDGSLLYSQTIGWNGGGSGTDCDPDDWVPVCGKRESSAGGGYTPSAEDMAATDWERAYPI